jgi:hypothetical protein
MAIFPWQKNKGIDRFANLLADEFFSRIQPELANEYVNNKKIGVENRRALKNRNSNIQKVNQALGAVVSEFIKFRDSQKLGIYGKARLHMKFMERLTDLGYQQEIAKKLNEEILLKTS